MLNWPVVVCCGQFDLRLENTGREPALISVGPMFNPREKLIPLIRGVGVEVGPGTNPQILPSRDVEVRYVETMSAEEWAKIYAKQRPNDVTTSLWDNYVVASANELEIFDDGSLDFVFSNHVFEHLVNPIGVLGNWNRKLRAQGIVAGAIPDARFTFDLRQPLSTLEECIEEAKRGSFHFERSHYARWCKYTAPYNTPEDLIARRYAIHAKYYSPDTFLDLLRYCTGWSNVAVQSTQNGKDFSFLLVK